jgi:hypothetical protein
MKQAFNVSDSTKNILLMVAGLVLLLFALGVFAPTLRILVIMMGIGVLALGFIRGGYWDKVMGLIKK